MKEMFPACEVVARYILPLFRSFVAKELIEQYGFTQIEAAEKLGTTQAAISQYVHLKRGHRAFEQFEEILPLIKEAAKETAKVIASENVDADEVTVSFCKLCTSLREEQRVRRGHTLERFQRLI